MTDVSRETERLVAEFDRFPDLLRYADILATRGVERGLIGPREVERLWPRHLANCAVVALEGQAVLPHGARVADVGSGAGLPGLVWAIVRPDLEVSLLEPLLRRSAFLTEVIDELGLSGRVRVLRVRAEDATSAQYQAVTARAVARLPQLLAWTLPLTAPGGWVLALKGASAGDEVAEARTAISRLGGGAVGIAQYGRGTVEPPTTVVQVQRTAPAPRRR